MTTRAGSGQHPAVVRYHETLSAVKGAVSRKVADLASKSQRFLEELGEDESGERPSNRASSPGAAPRRLKAAQ